MSEIFGRTYENVKIGKKKEWQLPFLNAISGRCSSSNPFQRGRVGCTRPRL